MCGLVGVIARTNSGLFTKDLDLFEWMLIVDTIRGKDSTGAFTGFRNKQARVIKTATHPFNMFRSADWGQFRLDAINRGKFIIGHNRAATRGEVKNANAHPFVEDNIILAHNGTLWDHDNLTKAVVEVDSHAIAHALTSDTPENVLPAIKGAFTLIWYDTKTEKLYAARNKERPLSIIVTDQTFVLTSEPWIAGGPMSKQDRKILDILDVEPGKLHSWDSSGKMEISSFKLHEFGGKQQQYKGKYYEDWSGIEDDVPFVPENAETPEIKDLREALGQTTKKPSTVCALMQTNVTGEKISTEISTKLNEQQSKQDGPTRIIQTPSDRNPLPTEEEQAAAKSRTIMSTD